MWLYMPCLLFGSMDHTNGWNCHRFDPKGLEMKCTQNRLSINDVLEAHLGTSEAGLRDLHNYVRKILFDILSSSKLNMNLVNTQRQIYFISDTTSQVDIC